MIATTIQELDTNECLTCYDYVTLDYPPQVDEQIFEPEVQAGEGDYAVLRCAVKGNPNPDIEWSKEGLLVSLNL